MKLPNGNLGGNATNHAVLKNFSHAWDDHQLSPMLAMFRHQPFTIPRIRLQISREPFFTSHHDRHYFQPLFLGPTYTYTILNKKTTTKTSLVFFQLDVFFREKNSTPVFQETQIGHKNTGPAKPRVANPSPAIVTCANRSSAHSFPVRGWRVCYWGKLEILDLPPPRIPVTTKMTWKHVWKRES